MKEYNSMKWYEYPLAFVIGGVLLAGVLYGAKILVDINNSRIEERTSNKSLDRIFEENGN